MIDTIEKLERAALEIRESLLELCEKQVIHIGGDLSIADIMTVLWQYQMKYDPKDPKWEGRDRFVLSKGHASAVTAFNQAAIGCFDKQVILDEYATDGGRFSMHSCALINPYVEVSTGSLGHGMPIATGMAAALRLKGNWTSRVYTIMGDGEQEEGSIWEAAMNAAHYNLGNVVGIIDRNGLEGDDTTERLSGLGDVAEKYRVFGWDVRELDGNDISQIKKAFDQLPPADSKKPVVLVCYTVKGKGVPYMENQAKWHTGKITHEQLVEATTRLEKEFEVRWKT